MLLTNRQICLILDLFTKEFGPGYSDDIEIAQLQAKLSLMKSTIFNKPLKRENHNNPVCNICGGEHFDFECPDRE